MASDENSDQPLQEFRHRAMPGYRLGFTAVFLLMAVYLGAIIYSSSGKVDHGYHGKEGKHARDHPAKSHQDSNHDSKPNERTPTETH